MPDFQTTLNKTVDDFVSQVTALAKNMAITTLESALGKGRGGLRLSGGTGGKRSSDELDELAKSFCDFVGKNPGLRIEQINKKLGTNTKDLALPIRKLIADGAIKTKGDKRATTYFAKA